MKKSKTKPASIFACVLLAFGENKKKTRALFCFLFLFVEDYLRHAARPSFYAQGVGRTKGGFPM